MQTKFDIKDKVAVIGEITHIDINRSGISYIVHVKDMYNSGFNIEVRADSIKEINNGSET